MKLKKWALIAEISGAVAIVVTLIILIVEVRGNSSAIRTQTISDQVDREIERRQWLFLNEGGLADIILKSRNMESLSEAEIWRLRRYYVALLDNFEWQFGEVHADRLPENLLAMYAWEGIWKDEPMIWDAWQRTRQFRDPVFVEYWQTNVIKE